MKFSLPIEEYVFRYSTILLPCAEKVVVDIGCKRGYGSMILNAWAKKVIATDVNNQLRVKLDFVQCDWTKGVPFKKEFDVAVCMEVLEHLEEPEKLIDNVPGVLKDDGMFIFTVPCVDRKTDTHLKPFYTEREITDLVERRFKVDFLTKHFNVSWMGIAHV